MKKAWIKLILFCIPLLLVLVGINYYVDPALLFHNCDKAIATAIMEGNCASTTTGNFDERTVKAYVMSEMPKDPECVVIGASLSMTINEDVAGTDSLYNLAFSGANYYDVLNTLGLMKIYGIHPDRVIWGIDINFFDNERDSRWEAFSDYGYYMESCLLGEDLAEPKEQWKQSIEYSQLFSLTYFQSSIDYIKTQGLESLRQERYTVVDLEDRQELEEAYYMPDASRVYAKSAQESTAEDVKADSLTYDIDYNITPGYSLSEERADMFARIIDYLESNGTEVELFLCPFAPSLWDRIDPDTYELAPEVEEYVTAYAEEYGLKITGSFNPYDLGMTDADFYDPRHVRREVLGEYFDFSE